jgi:hypothetical protein
MVAGPPNSFRPEMALFRNFAIIRRHCLCGVHEYASAQSLDFLELAENCAFLDRKIISALYKTARIDTK